MAHPVSRAAPRLALLVAAGLLTASQAPPARGQAVRYRGPYQEVFAPDAIRQPSTLQSLSALIHATGLHKVTGLGGNDSPTGPGGPDRAPTPHGNTLRGPRDMPGTDPGILQPIRDSVRQAIEPLSGDVLRETIDRVRAHIPDIRLLPPFFPKSPPPGRSAGADPSGGGNGDGAGGGPLAPADPGPTIVLPTPKGVKNAAANRALNDFGGLLSKTTGSIFHRTPALPQPDRVNRSVLFALGGLYRWEFWWENNIEEIARGVRERVPWEDAPKPGSPAAWLGNTPQRARRNPLRLDHQVLEDTLLPPLLAGLVQHDEDLVAASVLAVGRTRQADLQDVVDPLLRARNKRVVAAAILATGYLGREDRVDLLRRALTSPHAAGDVRVAAAAALGIHGGSGARAALDDYVGRVARANALPGGEVEPAVTAILALGSLGEEDAVGTLRGMLQRSDGGQRGRMVRAAAATALGRIGDPRATGVLIHALSVADEPVAQSAALALGHIGGDAAERALLRKFRGPADLQTRSFAALALGRIGAAAGREALHREIARPSSHVLLSYALLGLALGGDEDLPSIALPLLRSPAVSRSSRSAAAVALGLSGPALEHAAPALREESIGTLISVVSRRGENADLRGYAATALGLLRAREALTPVRKLLLDDSLWPARRGAAVGLGLLGDARAAADLTRAVREDTNPFVRAAAANSLGLLGDRSSAEALAAMARDRPAPGRPALERHLEWSFSTAAMGLLASPDRVDPLASLAGGRNYRLPLHSLDRLLQTL